MWGLQFPNPVGLAAGFDKNAGYLQELEVLGFGFVEIGTVTPLAQPGNDKPRLFRLPEDQAIINRMGFNNEGVKAVVERLREWQIRQSAVGSRQSKHSALTTQHSRMIIGGNIGKNKITPNEDAWKDYEICFNELFDFVDYFVVNVSSPNTPGLRELQEKDLLRKILSHLQTLRAERLKLKSDDIQKPILLKIAPDLTQTQLDDVIDLAQEIQLDGLVAANTTISRDNLSAASAEVSKETGGLSGKPLTKRSTEIVQYIQQKTNGRIPIMASGGIFTSADAKEKFAAGASFAQVWTGFIYEGPAIAKKICNGL